MMNKTLHILLIFLLLLTACSNEETIPSTATDWTPDISRSATGGQELRIEGRKDGVFQFANILIPAAEGGKATWKNNEKPDADKVNASNEFLAFAPAGDIPSSVTHDGTTEYFVDFHRTKPNSFTMTPLMAQLKVHIWVEETEVHTPANDSVYLYSKADIDFPNKTLTRLASRKHVCLGDVSKTDALEQDGHHFDKFSMDAPLVVIPQTIPAGEEVLWFSIEDAHYYFKPDAPIELKPGFLTSLTLHVIYVDEEGDPVEPPTKKVIAVDKHTITITPWAAGETYEDNIYNPDNN